jgi:hypothetical protein
MLLVVAASAIRNGHCGQRARVRATVERRIGRVTTSLGRWRLGFLG